MTGQRVEPLPLPPGPDVLAALPRLAAALSGDGSAVLAHPPGDEVPSLTAPAGTAVVVRTSGSTSGGRYVALPASALRASARATETALAHQTDHGLGPATWLLTLAPHHIAGVMVLVRSILAGTTPIVVAADGLGDPDALAEAITRMPTGGPRRASLVPTQLHRCLTAGGPALAALTQLDTVLVGGAATAPDLLARSRAAGIRVVTTYGGSESCGGCVYDGVPLPGVAVDLDGDGRIRVAGPVLASGYLDDPAATAEAFVTGTDGVRRWHTRDHGVSAGGVLTVVGRVDDAVLTGGVTVDPGPVEQIVADLPGVAEAVVVGVPDLEWGQRLVVAVVASDAALDPTPDLAGVRAAVTARLGAASAPRDLVVVADLPRRGPGKPDRRALAEMLVDLLRNDDHEHDGDGA